MILRDSQNSSYDEDRRRITIAMIAVAVAAVIAGGVFLLMRPENGEGKQDGRIFTDETTAAPETTAMAMPQPTVSDAEMLEYIRSHPDIYGERLTELAEKNSETIFFVYTYPEREKLGLTTDLTAEAASAEIPLLLQWDMRWGYTEYGGGIIGTAGCGPVSLCMVSLWLTGDTSVTPQRIASYAKPKGYVTAEGGTDWALIGSGSFDFGMSAAEIPVDKTLVTALLERGFPLIVNVGPGTFTERGHYMVLTGCHDGKITLNDPNSRANSAVTWTFDEMEDQIRNIWALWGPRLADQTFRPANDGVNIRTEPSLNAEATEQVTEADTFAVTEIDKGDGLLWGYIPERGWICMTLIEAAD